MTITIPLWYLIGCATAFILDIISTSVMHYVNRASFKEWREANNVDFLGRFFGYFGAFCVCLLASLLSWLEVILWLYLNLSRKEMFRLRTKAELKLEDYDNLKKTLEQY